MNNPRQFILQLRSLQAYLRTLADEAENYGLLWHDGQMVGGGACSSQMNRASIRDFQNRLMGKRNSPAGIFARISTQANWALAQLNQTPIQNVAAVRNGYDLAQLIRGRAMMIDVTIFEIRASLPLDVADVVNLYCNKKNMKK